MRSIRCLPLVSAIVCSVAPLRSLPAQEPASNASIRSVASEYLAVSGLDEMGRLGVRLNQRVFVDGMVKGDTGRVRDSVRAFATRYVTWDSLRDDAVRLLTERFTEREIRDLLAFLRTGGGSVYARAMADVARRYVDSSLPVDTIRARFGRAVLEARATEEQAAELGRFVSTPLGRKFIQFPLEITALGNREFITRVQKGLPVLQTMVKGAVPVDTSREADFSGPGLAARKGRTSNEPYFEFKVDKQVAPLPSAARVRYPKLLRAANVEGEVLLQFVVDTNGRADRSRVKVLRSSHELFTAAAKEVLPELRFTPAEVGKRKVSQWVQMPFTFSLDRETRAVAKP